MMAVGCAQKPAAAAGIADSGALHHLYVYVLKPRRCYCCRCIGQVDSAVCIHRLRLPCGGGRHCVRQRNHRVLLIPAAYGTAPVVPHTHNCDS
jgi:hypothetical protein